MTGYHTSKYGVVAPLIDDALVAKGLGSCVALARHCGVNKTSVTRWRDGTSAPERHRWPAVEQFLDLPPGSIAKLVDQ